MFPHLFFRFPPHFRPGKLIIEESEEALSGRYSGWVGGHWHHGWKAKELMCSSCSWKEEWPVEFMQLSAHDLSPERPPRSLYTKHPILLACFIFFMVLLAKIGLFIIHFPLERKLHKVQHHLVYCCISWCIIGAQLIFD